MTLSVLAIAFIGGLLAGAVLYQTLWWNVQMLSAGKSPLKVVAIQVARLALLAGVLIVAATFGAMPLLVTALGLMASRSVAIRFVGVPHD
jgi:F1F0 ATPase subunit 2